MKSFYSVNLPLFRQKINYSFTVINFLLYLCAQLLHEDMNYINTALLILSVFSFNSCENNNSRKAAHLLERGQTLALSNKPDSAILYYREAIELLKDAPDNELTGSIYNHAGNLFFSADIYDKACEAYQNAFSYNSRLADKTGACESLRGMAKSFLCRRQRDSAAICLTKAEGFIGQVRDSNEISRVYDNLSAFYLMKEEYARSLHYNRKATQVIKDSAGLHRNWLAKAIILIKTGEYDSARHYLEYSRHSGNIYTKAGSYLKLAELCRIMQDGDSSKYLALYQGVKDSIERCNTQNRLSNADFKYTLHKTMRENNARLFIFASIAFVSLSLILVLVFRYRKKHSQNTKTILDLHKKMSELQNRLGQSQEKESEQSRINEKLSEMQATIISNMEKSATKCAGNFMKTKLYSAMQKKLKDGSLLDDGDLGKMYKAAMSNFSRFVGYLDLFLNLTKDDCYLCCLSLSRFTTKECALFRQVSEEAIRKQRSRIRKRIMEIFNSVELYDFIFQK